MNVSGNIRLKDDGPNRDFNFKKLRKNIDENFSINRERFSDI